MSTVLYSSPIFGPVHSRRLGISLGINLMPADGKICTFDCIYCECGRNGERRPSSKRPSRDDVRQALEARLLEMKEQGPEPNVLTFAGNGEPTAHPDFPGIVDDVLALRDKYFPKAEVSVLSNGTRIFDDAVFTALMRLDNNIQKLDTVDPEYIGLIDSPVGHYDVEKVIERLCAFGGRVMIQTMFLTGTLDGRDMDNTSDRYVLPWLDAVKRINPYRVFIYTIARETPVNTLAKAPAAVLDGIAGKLRTLGFETVVSY